jgi:hypothetical protein
MGGTTGMVMCMWVTGAKNVICWRNAVSRDHSLESLLSIALTRKRCTSHTVNGTIINLKIALIECETALAMYPFKNVMLSGRT